MAMEPDRPPTRRILVKVGRHDTLASIAARNGVSVDDLKSWNKLSRAQQEALQPLAGEWNKLEALRKQKWLDIANRFIPAVVRQTVIRFPLLAANSPTVAQPRPGLSLAIMKDRLLESAIQNGELLGGEFPGDPKTMTISHPILGINNVLDIMGIMAAHEERHQTQIQNVLKDPRLPQAQPSFA